MKIVEYFALVILLYYDQKFVIQSVFSISVAQEVLIEHNSNDSNKKLLRKVPEGNLDRRIEAGSIREKTI